MMLLSEIPENTVILKAEPLKEQPCPIVGRQDLRNGVPYPSSTRPQQPERSPPSINAKPERVAYGGSTKARQRSPSRYERRREKDKRQRFQEAVAFAHVMDWPLNMRLTISWDALLLAGEHNEGHCLSRAEEDREAYARAELNRLCRSVGLPFAAIWGRDRGPKLGKHVHMSMFFPSPKIDLLVSLLERITGSSADSTMSAYPADVAACSVCGGWQLKRNTWADDKASDRQWVDYIATQHDKHPTPPQLLGKAFGISHALGRGAQERARSMRERS